MGFTKLKAINYGTAIVIILVVTSLALTFTTYAALSTTQNVNSTGTITVSANLGVYSDNNCQNTISTIDWGNITPGANITRTVYIKNTGTGVSLALSMGTSGWNPTTANGPIAISWNRDATRLIPGQSVAANLTLSVSPSIVDITNFSVQVTITGTQ